MYEEHVENNTAFSLRKCAKALGISTYTVKLIFEEDLKIAPYKRIKAHLLQDTHKLKRNDRSKILYRRYCNLNILKFIMFSDEKYFTLNHNGYIQIDRCYGSKENGKKGIPQERLLKFGDKNSRKLLVWAGISYHGKIHLEILKEGENMTGDRYRRLIKEVVYPKAKMFYPKIVHNGGIRRILTNMILQQDGATCHTANATISLLKKIRLNYIKKTEWPPKSPDLNPCDYR